MEVRAMNKLVEVKMGIYKHFKGNAYELFDLAEHTETGETMAIYRSINRERYCDNGIVYARPYDMFFSKVDKVKHPGVEQEYRFEYMSDKLDKHPLGIMPKWLHDLNRMNELKACIKRREDAGIRCLAEWRDELDELVAKYYPDNGGSYVETRSED